MASIREILAVEETNLADVFRGPAVESRIERTFGGQIAAQAVAAAQRTVSGKDIHSLHGYFVGPGDVSRPIEIRVERIREGKSFANRQVRVYQGHVLLLLLWLVSIATGIAARSIRILRQRCQGPRK